MFLHKTINELRGWLIILYILVCMLFYPLYYDMIRLTSLKLTQAFHVLATWFCCKSKDFKIRNSVWITEGLDTGDSDNRGPTVCT